MPQIGSTEAAVRSRIVAAEGGQGERPLVAMRK